MTKKDAKLLSITVLGHSMAHIYILVITAILLHLADEFNVTLSRITAVDGLCYFLFGAGSLPAGYLVSKTNPQFTLKLFFLLSAIASVFVGLSNSFMSFSISLAFLGLAGSFYHVSGLTLLSHHVEKKGRSYGIHGVAGIAGVSIAPVLGSAVTYFWGWKTLYFLLAVPGIIGFIMLYLDKAIPLEASVKAPRLVKDKKAGNNAILGYFIILLGVMAINGFVYRGFLTVFPIHIAENVTISRMPELLKGGALAGLILSVGMIGQLIGGVLSDKYETKAIYLMFISVSMPVFFLVSLLKDWNLILASSFLTLSFFPSQTIENHMISNFTPRKHVGLVFGLKFILAFGVSSIAAFAAGFITEKYSTSVFFLFTAVLGMVSIVLASVFYYKTRRFYIEK